MNSKLELHDSVISEIHEFDRTVVVEFAPAYVHKSQGTPGLDAGTGWVQNARMRLTGATISGDPPRLPGTSSEGSLRVGKLKHDNLLPVPLRVVEPVELCLVFSTGQETVISAEAIALELTGEAQEYVEEFSGGGVDPYHMDLRPPEMGNG